MYDERIRGSGSALCVSRGKERLESRNTAACAILNTSASSTHCVVAMHVKGLSRTSQELEKFVFSTRALSSSSCSWNNTWCPCTTACPRTGRAQTPQHPQQYQQQP